MKTWAVRNGSRVVRLMAGRCNVFALLQGTRFLLVDTGRRNRRKGLFRRLEALCARGYEFTALVLTHAHFDHAENAAAVHTRYGVPAYIGRGDMGPLMLGSNPPIRGIMGLMKPLISLAPANFIERFRYEPVTDALSLEAGGYTDFLGFTGVSVLSVPGHSAGSICIIADGDIAIAGDAMHGVFPGNAWPPFGDCETELLASWNKLLAAGCGRFLPSHGRERGRDLVARQYQKLIRLYADSQP